MALILLLTRDMRGHKHGRCPAGPQHSEESRITALLGRQLGLYSAALFLVALLMVMPHEAQASGSNSTTIRLAVGPFFAPATDSALREIAASLPDCLAVELSHQDRFEVLERDQVADVWSELHLTAAGLTSKDTLAQLGRVLNCDWLVTGSLVKVGTHGQAWTKVIAIKSGVVLDLEAIPFGSSNVSNNVASIVEFLGRTSSRSQPHQYIALGRFSDLSVASTRKDWSRQLSALLEKHFAAAGVGILEREAAAPIFEEYEMERNGLMGNETSRVKLQSSFWLIDGACKWVGDEDKLNVMLRVQRIGEKQQVFKVTKTPGPELESAVVEAVRLALGGTNQVQPVEGATDEARIHNARGMDGAANNDEFSPSRYSAQAPLSERQQKWWDNRRATLESFEKAIMLNPNDHRAKYMLAYGLIGDPDPARQERGTALLRELAASSEPQVAEGAKRTLTNLNFYLGKTTGPTGPPTRPRASATTTHQIDAQ